MFCSLTLTDSASDSVSSGSERADGGAGGGAQGGRASVPRAGRVRAGEHVRARGGLLAAGRLVRHALRVRRGRRALSARPPRAPRTL